MALVRVQRASEQNVRWGVTGTQLDCLLQRAQPTGEVSRVRQDGAHGDVCVGKRRIELERFCRRGECLGRGFGGRCHPTNRAENVTVGERRPRGGVFRVEVQSPPRVTERDLEGAWRSRRKRMPALQILEMRFRVDRLTTRELHRLRRRNLDRDLPRDRLGELALQPQHVLEIAVVAVRPQRFIGAGRYELDVHAHSLVDEERRAYEHRVHIELASDVGKRFLDSLISHHRCRRDDAERLHFREVGDQ